MLASCANRGMGPQGGKKDITPPRVARSIPAQNATDVSSQRIEINFDEYVLLEDAYNNVTVSPPQKRMPVIKLAGKKITVELKDTLQPNTTYTIDFGSTIADNNEKNVLPNFAFAFATGAELDTLQISGTLLNAQTLDPIANSLTGIHSDLSDTAFTTLPFDRITKTDAKGRFAVKNVKAGDYRVFALSQNVNDGYRFDPKSPVAVAFSENILQPDTLSKDTAKIADSLRFNNLILFQYEEKKADTLTIEAKRERKEKFTLTFNKELNNVSQIEARNFDLKESAFKISPKRNEITFWLDSTLAKIDTLHLVVRHLTEKIDSVHILLGENFNKLTIDSISATNLAKKDNNAKIQLITNNITGGKLEYYDSLKLFFDVPVKDSTFKEIHLRHGKDTVDMPISFRKTDNYPYLSSYAVIAPLEESENYTLTIDSAAVFDVFGKAADKTSIGFKRRALSEYSTLALDLQPFDSRIVVELLDEKDQPVRQSKAESGGTYFDYVEAGNYYLRLFIDENGDETWNGGSYLEHRQPEKMYYYPKKITLRANWEVREDWDYSALPIWQQKPQELKAKTTTKK